MSETGKVYQIQYPTTVSGKVYNVRDVSGEQNVTGKVYQVASVNGGGGGGGASSDEWQPNPNWWDIKKILDEDTRDYPGKIGVIMYNFSDVSNFELTDYSIAAVATSDGAFYTYADGANVTHRWDTTKDKDDGRGFKTRWVIYYHARANSSDTFSYSEKKFGWEDNYIAYLVLRVNLLYGGNFCKDQRMLEAVDNDGFVIAGTSFANFCSGCYALQKLPDALDTSNSTTFNNFCQGCYSLRKLPDMLDASKGTNFNFFCNNCSSLRKLPDVLDTSSGTTFRSFCNNCYSLQKMPDALDTSNSTDFSSFCNYCYSLTRLPDELDTSNGRDFANFCAYCDSLQKLPDVLDTSNGTGFNGFYKSCSSLKKLPEITMAANTSNISSKYNAPFNSSSWLVELPLTLPSDTNFWLDSSTRISIESFRYIADHAPDVTATPRTLTVGSTNISRINAADPTIITDLNAKGWTVA